MKDTEFQVVTQGSVRMLHNVGYMVVGGADAVCFYIDPVNRAHVESSTVSATNCPVISIASVGGGASTDIEFSEFPGWRFHSGGAGKTIAIALVRG